jgi:pimeloyl-ACP methyl ester carboxylesterase
MSDRKVIQHFAKKAIKPVFKTYLIDNTEIHLAEIGNDTLPTVIFFHGSPGSWDAFIDFFSDTTLLNKVHLISVDRPGFGKSDLGNAEPSLQRQAYLLSPVLKLNRNKKLPVLIGHSLGGPVIARLAMDYQSQIGSLIFVAGSVSPDLEPKEWYRPPMKFLGKIGLLSDEIDVSNREIMPLKGELQKMMPLWKNITCPVTFIQGDADMLVPAGNADFTKKMLTHNPSVKIIMLPKVNHFIPWTHPQVIKEAIFESVK